MFWKSLVEFLGFQASLFEEDFAPSLPDTFAKLKRVFWSGWHFQTEKDGFGFISKFEYFIGSSNKAKKKDASQRLKIVLRQRYSYKVTVSWFLNIKMGNSAFLRLI